MAKLDFYFDTQKVNEDIANWRDLEIEVNFDDDGGQGVVKTGAFEFVGALADKINKWNAGGMTGGAGIFEAPSFGISVCGSNDKIFDGGINVADCSASYECDKVVAPLRANSIDFINDRATSFTFAYLASLPNGAAGQIRQQDYVKVPYVINSIPDYFGVMIAGVSLFMMLKEVKEITEKTAGVIEELSGDTVMTTAAAASITAPTVAPGMAVGRVLADITRITFYILYLVFVLITIIELLKTLFDNLIQEVKYKKGMRVRSLFIAACDYLGMQFYSNLLTNNHFNDVIIPRKIAYDFNVPTATQTLLGMSMLNKDYNDDNNPASVGYFEGTFADLILAEEQRLNAELRVIGNDVYFEQKDYFANNSSYTLPNIQRRNADPHGTNACELASNYLVKYSLDDQDTNTYDQYSGTSCQMQLVPNIILNKRNVLLKNLTEVNLPYALAKRKNTDNNVEKVYIAIYQVIKSVYNVTSGFVNTVSGVINAILSVITAIIPGGGGLSWTIPTINPMPNIPFTSRIGCMLLSSDFIGVPKILVINAAGLLDSNNENLTAAKTLMDELHYTNFAVRKTLSDGVTPKNDFNQWLTYTDKDIPFCCENYKSILNNNFITTYDQKLAKIKSLVWNPYKETAKITYRVKEQYTNNFNQKYIIDGK